MGLGTRTFLGIDIPSESPKPQKASLTKNDGLKYRKNIQNLLRKVLFETSYGTASSSKRYIILYEMDSTWDLPTLPHLMPRVRNCSPFPVEDHW